MSQVIFDSIDPAISGTDLATVLNDFKAAIVSGFSGTTRPTELDQGGGWIDMTNDPTYWTFKIWTGTDDVEIFRINLSTALASVSLAVEEFSVKKITADTAGAILKLIKQRIANNGQVLSGDTVGRLQFIGRANDSSNPVVAEIKWDATDDQTSSAFGGELSLWSVADASGTLTKHMRLVDGLVETLLPLKINSLRLESQNVATAATIAQLSASKSAVEMTGAIATAIEGIDSAGNAKVVTIHNRSSAVVTLKHQDAGATAADRFKLPGSLDYAISVDGSATLYYCTADTRWKLKSTAEKNFSGITVETFYGPNTWTSPAATTNAKIRAYKKYPGMTNEGSDLLDIYQTAYAWGINANGQLGLGDVASRSSPIAVLGSLGFVRLWGDTGSDGHSQFGLANTGLLYAWGINNSGQLGVSDVTPRSSPVAVAGGLHYQYLWAREKSAFSLTTNNLLYAWGVNTNGQLGLGDVAARSAPVAVLLGLKIGKLALVSGAAGALAAVALSTTGTPYAWGINTNGNLGLGDVIPRSSPVAVLGSFTFSELIGAGVSSAYHFNALKTDGTVYSWGDNTKGQLGVGDVVPRSSPVAVVGNLNFKKVIGHRSSQSVYGLTTAGVLYAWGANDQGQLGVGDTTARSSPVAVLGSITFEDVKVYKSTIFGRTADGTTYAWGLNANGQLGVGDVVSRSSPVAVLGGFKFTDLRFADGPTDDYSVFGINSAGTVYSWGKNTNGTLALGDVTPRSSPVAIVGSFNPDMSEPTVSSYLTVVASTAYAISITNGVSYFGNLPLGAGIYKVEVEYLQ